ncbi:MAG TPA: hypothetical protein VGQ93_06440 [Lysobacter sp.]|nr:hypothetical protein [Lysobacter sp.]
MKTLIAAIGFLFFATAFAADVRPAPAEQSHVHRYLVERTFPSGALDRLDAAGKAKVNATNAKFGVNWVMSMPTPTRP